MKTTIFLMLFASPVLSFAQSVTCKPHGSAHYTSLEISKPPDSIEVPWFEAKLGNEYNQTRVFTLISTSRGDHLLFISQNGKQEFTLDFGPYHGPGVYHSVQLALNAGAKDQEQATLMCDQIGDLGFVNSCKLEKPEDAFFTAIRMRNADQVEAQLECGMNANIKNDKGCTPLLVLGDEFCGLKLESPISYTSMENALPIVELLKKKGASIEAKDPASGERPLHKFAKNGDYDVVDYLLTRNGDVNAQDDSGFTPLMRAVQVNNHFLVGRIVEESPQLGLKNKDGQTALAIAENLGFKALIPLLQEPQDFIRIEAQVDGSCAPLKVKIKANQVSKFTLKATEDDMFLLESPRLGLSLMADAESEVSKNVIPSTKGTFEFTCGVHGGSKQSVGEIVVE